MPRVVKSREEFEGEIFESLVLVEGKDLPLHAAGTEFTEIAKSRRRVDGVQRVTGRARYTQDVYPPGMLYVRVLRSPYPRARVRRIDTKKAEKLPGVRDILHRFNAPKAAYRGDDTVFREEVRFVGEEVAAVAADDEQTAVEALRLIEVDYELLPHVVDLEEAIGDMAPRLDPDGNVAEAATHKRGDAKRALKEADFVVDATYRTSTQIHNSFETHGAVATWDGDRLTVYESTQHTFAVRQGLRTALKLPFSKIRVLCDYMGGGFGSKGSVGKHSIIASLFTMRLGRPVRYVLTREEENIAAGNRSATLQQMRIGGKGGRITGLEHISWANVGQGKWVANPTGPTNTLYDIANLSSKSYKV
ncbi:MAG: molybdopterin-dependent oxidoreductase, partial [Chloroflexota bacterium]|nr:molybdopterin-dependent oxidoreductase [Chloroflexota bacterium]